MTISGAMTAVPLRAVNESEGSAPSTVGVEMLKKAQDQMKQQGEALIQSIEQSGSQCSSCHHLDVYA